MKAERTRVHHLMTNELLFVLPKCEIIVSIENVNDMPAFCLSQYSDENLGEVSGKQYVMMVHKNLDTIKDDFKDATRALVIFEPEKFIADVHKIERHKFVDDKIRYYDYDINSLRMYMFLATGNEEIQIGVEKSMTYENRCRHLVCKDLDFEQQHEYQFICTDELITEAVFYPFEFTSAYAIVPIDRLYSPLKIPEKWIKKLRTTPYDAALSHFGSYQVVSVNIGAI